MLLAALFACSDPSTDPGGPAAEVEPELPYNGLIERHGERDVLYLWGTRYEMGYAEGAATCDRMGTLFTRYLLGELVGRHSDYTYDIARAFVLGSVTFEPADIEEILGFWDGANAWCTEEQLTVESELLPAGPYRMELDDLLFANAVADFGCTSFSAWGAASATGDTVAGRNFDWAIDPEGTFVAQHLLKVYDSADDGARFASVMVPGLTGCVTCLTDERLLLTMHNTTGLTADEPAGISPRMLSARAALVATAGVADPVGAADAVLDARRQLTGNNLHLAMPVERGGGIGAVVFEVDGQASNPDGQSTVRYPGEDTQNPRLDLTIAANHYAKRRIDLGDDDSNGRVDTLVGLIAEAPVAAEDGRALLASVQNGYDGVTAHSVVFDAAANELRMFVAPNHDTPALDAEPTVFAMDEVFGRLAELSGE